MVRRHHLALADDRAIEHEEERDNPVERGVNLFNQPTPQQSMVGRGATPSMGLSQFRGGVMRKATRAKAMAARSEAHMMGEHLGKHLADLHGGAYRDEFCHGLSGGSWSDFWGKVKNEFVNPNSVLREKALPTAAKVATYASPLINAAAPGVGTAISTGLNAVQFANKTAQEHGFGHHRGGNMEFGNVKTGAYHGQGHDEDEAAEFMKKNPNFLKKSRKTKAKRAPASAGDGRRKRAEIVKQVMAQKGLKMIEASKYVKEHGLY